MLTRAGERHVAGARISDARREADFGPHRLARRQARHDTPLVGERAHEDVGNEVAARVRDLDAGGVGDDLEREAEVAARGAAVGESWTLKSWAGVGVS